MIPTLRNRILRGLETQVSATGLGLFRLLFGLVAFQEILYLIYFRHLIFDRIPNIEPASPVVHLFLALWALATFSLALGFHTRLMAVINYLLWVIYVGFTPMWIDFDGGFDQMMVGLSFFMIFLPSERALSLDNLRYALRHSSPGRIVAPPDQVPLLSYTLPLVFGLGCLYLDAGIHKLSAEFWRNGMGAWLPSTMPYYISPLDMSWLLEQPIIERIIGYGLIAFQFLFLPLCLTRIGRVPLLLAGLAFHVGIVVSLNIYQFGFGMLIQYVLMVPFRWWRTVSNWIRVNDPVLTVFYDGECPLCTRTVIVLSHFDIRHGVRFLDLQTHASNHPALSAIPESTLLTDLYALDRSGRIHAGVDTYARILRALGYTAPIGWLLQMPPIRQVAALIYRRIADNRRRVPCGDHCTVAVGSGEDHLRLAWAEWVGSPRRQATRVAKLVVVAVLLQANSTLQFGVFFRLNGGHATTETGQMLEGASNALLFFSHTFFGITPHALYMHDHFVGYEHLLGIVWRDPAGVEHWLNFVNEEGRIVAPNWGRVQCWWANIAVTPHIKRRRLDKALSQVTAFWGPVLGADLKSAEFVVKVKEIRVPMDWEPNLRAFNLQQPWRDIGRVVWQDEKATIEFPGVDLEQW